MIEPLNKEQKVKLYILSILFTILLVLREGLARKQEFYLQNYLRFKIYNNFAVEHSHDLLEFLISIDSFWHNLFLE